MKTLQKLCQLMALIGLPLGVMSGSILSLPLAFGASSRFSETDSHFSSSFGGSFKKLSSFLSLSKKNQTQQEDKKKYALKIQYQKEVEKSILTYVKKVEKIANLCNFGVALLSEPLGTAVLGYSLYNLYSFHCSDQPIKTINHLVRTFNAKLRNLGIEELSEKEDMSEAEIFERAYELRGYEQKDPFYLSLAISWRNRKRFRF